MKDFDQEREKRHTADRTFKIGGEQFSHKAAVRPEVLFRGDAITVGMPAAEVVAISDEMILAFLEEENDNQERWVKLRKRIDDPITIEDITNLIAWLIQEQTGRPPTLPVPSASGQDQNGTTSTVGSSLQPAEA